MVNQEGFNQSETLEVRAKRNIEDLISEIYYNFVGDAETDLDKIIESWEIKSPEERAAYKEELSDVEFEMGDGVTDIMSIEARLREHGIRIKQPGADEKENAIIESKIWATYDNLKDTLGVVLDKLNQ